MTLRFAWALAATFLVGCATAPQEPIQLGSDAFRSGSGRVGVAMVKLPKVDTHLPGADCLLCLAAASLANSSLTTHARTLPYEDLPDLKLQIAELIKGRGGEAVVISEEIDLANVPDSSDKSPGMAPKNFAALGQKHGVNRLVVIDVNMLGFLRTYASYFPTSDPKAVLRGAGYMVNLSTNKYEWYHRVDIVRSADGKWDEAPKFPGLTNAYFQALEMGKDSFLSPLSQ